MQIEYIEVKPWEGSAMKLTFYITLGLGLQFKRSINAVWGTKVSWHILLKSTCNERMLEMFVRPKSR